MCLCVLTRPRPGRAGEDRLTETMTISFGAFKVVYAEQRHMARQREFEGE